MQKKKGTVKIGGPLFQCPPWAPRVCPQAEAQTPSCSGFGLGYSKSDESSQSRHAQSHASNNGHAH